MFEDLKVPLLAIVSATMLFGDRLLTSPIDYSAQ